jgi:hypothetical protein
MTVRLLLWESRRFMFSAQRALPSLLSLRATRYVHNIRMIQHTVFFKFPSIATEVPTEIANVVNQFNKLPGIVAQFHPHGVGISGCLSKETFLEKVSWPDKTEGYTHCLLVVASDDQALKGYLHSDEHLKVWMPAVKPYIEGLLVFDNVLDPSMVESMHQLYKNSTNNSSTAAAAASIESFEGLCASEALPASSSTTAAVGGGEYASLTDAEVL